MEYQQLVKLYYEGRNIVMHGPGGCGKSWCIEEFVSSHEFTEQSINYAIIAPTGVAACNINGFTIHSYFKIPVIYHSGDSELYVETSVRKSKYYAIPKLDLLIIDEISMVSDEMFAIIDAVLRSKYNCGRPFGGIQCIISGDFFQLPPVCEHKEKNQRWAFKSPIWQDMNFEYIHFTSQKRFTCPKTINLLMQMRIGEIAETDKEWLQARHIAYKRGDHLKLEVQPVTLFALNAPANKINAERLAKISAELVTFMAKDNVAKKGSLYPQKVKDILDKLADQVCDIKVGANVLFYRNYSLPERIVNGTLGKIVSIRRDVGIVSVQLHDGRIVEIVPKTYEISDGGWSLSRTQYPFRACWAMTMHKAQGTTLDSLIVDLSNCNNPGQMYTTLARVRDIQNLYVMRPINYAYLIVDLEVLEYFRNMLRNMPEILQHYAPSCCGTMLDQDEQFNILESVVTPIKNDNAPN